MSDVDTMIKEANLEEDFNVWSGECLSVAKAISDSLGGKVVLFSEIPCEGFDHACVEINGKLYDGSGRVNWTETVNRFLAKECVKTDIDENFYYSENPEEEFPRAFDDRVYESVKSRIQ